eukprot:TRINITY_DN8245_c0_g1_i1.p1 TRINITY_DN8245_c0_g1~~TRINITY_DN8245_c0_g1_i1.p1  ORF type:complete len:675 (-),score=170.10 TRINITY_DN8245_c0_g1_i1:7-2031(-)
MPEGKFFAGVVVCLEMGAVTLKRKKELTLLIQSHGGSVEFVITKKTSHVITVPELFDSFKIKKARSYGCFIVEEVWISDCESAGRKLDEASYHMCEPGQKREKSYEKSVHNFMNKAFANVTALLCMTKQGPEGHLRTACLNIAALCVGLGAPVPTGPIRTKQIVNSLFLELSKPQRKLAISSASIRPTTTTTNTTGFPSLLSKPSTSTSLFGKSNISSNFTSALQSVGTFSSLSLPKYNFGKALTTTSLASSSLVKPNSINSLYDAKKKEEAERKRKQAEEREAKINQFKAAMKERDVQLKEKEAARRVILDAKKSEAAAKRDAEEEVRRIKNEQMKVAREQKMAEEKKKRGEVLNTLQQNTYNTDVSDFFKKVDEAERKKREEEEWLEHKKQLDEENRKRLEKQERHRERQERVSAEKQQKKQDTQASIEASRLSSQEQKNQRRSEYNSQKDEEARKKKEAWEKSHKEYLEREQKRQERSERETKKQERERLAKLKPPPIDRDPCKVFVASISMDDLEENKKLSTTQINQLKDQRLTILFSFFEKYGTIIKRKVHIPDPNAPAAPTTVRMNERGIVFGAPKKKADLKGKEKGGIQCFVTYETPEAALACATSMVQATRDELCNSAKQKLLEQGKDVTICPQPSFYVRLVKKKKKKVIKRRPKQDPSSAPEVGK